MKTPSDPRHKKRIKQVHKLFAYSFSKDKAPKSIESIVEKLEEIDKLIQEAAPEWPLNTVNKIDLSILRLAVYEILFEKDIPKKVTIDEAVEIAKIYGSDSSPSFINGVLGTILDNENERD